MVRVQVTFWALVVVTIVASGVFTRALGAPPSAETAMAVAVAGLLAVLSGTLALRILIVVTRHRQKSTRSESESWT